MVDVVLLVKSDRIELEVSGASLLAPLLVAAKASADLAQGYATQAAAYAQQAQASVPLLQFNTYAAFVAAGFVTPYQIAIKSDERFNGNSTLNFFDGAKLLDPPITTFNRTQVFQASNNGIAIMPEFGSRVLDQNYLETRPGAYVESVLDGSKVTSVVYGGQGNYMLTVWDDPLDAGAGVVTAVNPPNGGPQVITYPLATTGAKARRYRLSGSYISSDNTFIVNGPNPTAARPSYIPKTILAIRGPAYAALGSVDGAPNGRGGFYTYDGATFQPSNGWGFRFRANTRATALWGFNFGGDVQLAVYKDGAQIGPLLIDTAAQGWHLILLPASAIEGEYRIGSVYGNLLVTHVFADTFVAVAHPGLPLYLTIGDSIAGTRFMGSDDSRELSSYKTSVARGGTSSFYSAVGQGAQFLINNMATILSQYSQMPVEITIDIGINDINITTENYKPIYKQLIVTLRNEAVARWGNAAQTIPLRFRSTLNTASYNPNNPANYAVIQAQRQVQQQSVAESADPKVFFRDRSTVVTNYTSNAPNGQLSDGLHLNIKGNTDDSNAELAAGFPTVR